MSCTSETVWAGQFLVAFAKGMPQTAPCLERRCFHLDVLHHLLQTRPRHATNLWRHWQCNPPIQSASQNDFVGKMIVSYSFIFIIYTVCIYIFWKKYVYHCISVCVSVYMHACTNQVCMYTYAKISPKKQWKSMEHNGTNLLSWNPCGAANISLKSWNHIGWFQRSMVSGFASWKWPRKIPWDWIPRMEQAQSNWSPAPVTRKHLSQKKDIVGDPGRVQYFYTRL